jgi:geranylgeranyl reductase family protein
MQTNIHTSRNNDTAGERISVEEAANQDWDVTVVGAGPAGATAAIHLAKRRRRVLLLDRSNFPRDKVCGDALIPDAIRSIERAGLYEEVLALGLETNLGSVFSPSRIQFEVPGQFITIKRVVLDNLIVRKAMSHGARFCQAAITGVETQSDRTVNLRVGDTGAEIKSQVVLLATGASVELAAKLGVVAQPGPSALALRCYVRAPLALDKLVVSYDRSITPGYAWIFPLPDGEFNIGCGIFYRGPSSRRINLRDAFREFVESFPLAVELMQKAEATSPLRGAMLRCGLRGTNPVGPANTLVIGESIGATFPFTGEGIGKAMETGEVAAQVVDEALETSRFDRLAEFAQRVERELKPKFLGYQIAEDWFSRPWLNDLVARRARRSRYLRESLAGIVNETVDPREVFSLAGMLRSLFR